MQEACQFTVKTSTGGTDQLRLVHGELPFLFARLDHETQDITRIFARGGQLLATFRNQIPHEGKHRLVRNVDFSEPISIINKLII